MTTIAFDGTSIAADTECWAGHNLSRTCHKLHEIALPTHTLYLSCAGSVKHILCAINYYKNGGTKPQLDDIEGIVVRVHLQNPIYTVCRIEDTLMEDDILEDQYAIGTGADFAMSYMELLGGTADKAVAYALKKQWNTADVDCLKVIPRGRTKYERVSIQAWR